MKRWGVLFVLPLVLAAKGASGDSTSLFRQGDDAFRGGQCGRAADLYDRASVRTMEPALAAYNLATARYRQAQQNLASLADAEINYRACLQSSEYRARAQFGLGNCLLMRATTGATLDRALLRAAIDRFSACLGDERCEEALREDARYNRAKAKLLLMQAPPAPQGKDDESPGDEPKDRNEPPSAKDKDQSTNSGDSTQTTNGSTGKRIERPETNKKDGQQSPGKSALLQPPDDKEAAPLPKDDAALHVQLAAKRILEELSAYRRGKARPMSAGGKDW